MLSWLKISLVLCFFGFLKEFRPSESYVTEFMAYPWRNITTEELNKDVWPYATYSTALQLIIVLLITDFLRYKPVIIAIGFAGILTWALLVWTTSFAGAIAIQIFYGSFVATEVAYYTYIYAKVDKEHYSTVTSHTRAALLGGRFLSATVGQLVLFTKFMDLRQVHMITFGAQIAATVWAFFLPPVKHSLYFNRSLGSDFSAQDSFDINDAGNKNNGKCSALRTKFTTAFEIIWFQFSTAFKNRKVQLWSIWYAMGMCGHLQVGSYVQMLWVSIDNSPEVIWNGAVDACTTLMGACMALLASQLHERFLNTNRMLWLLVILSSLQAGGLFIGTNTTNRFVAYAGYMFYYVFYIFTITISSAEIAKNIPEDSFGLIFGINTFAAMVFQSLLTFIVVTNAVGFNFNVGQQFNIYGCFYIALGAIYVVPIGYRLIKNNNKVTKAPEVINQINDVDNKIYDGKTAL